VATDRSEVQAVLESLRRQRVRQGEVEHALNCLILHLRAMTKQPSLPAVARTGQHLLQRALELRGMHRALPRFAVADLIEDSIARLERAQLPSGSQGIGDH